jgi:hypothetical protein
MRNYNIKPIYNVHVNQKKPKNHQKSPYVIKIEHVKKNRSITDVIDLFKIL